MSSSDTSSRCAASLRALARILRATIDTAAPATGVLREAYVPIPNGAVSVSPSSTTTSSAGRPSSCATICAHVVSCPWPCVFAPVRRMALPVMWILSSAESNILMPRMSYSRLLPAPSGSVIVEMPRPSSLPRLRAAACSRLKSSYPTAFRPTSRHLPYWPESSRKPNGDRDEDFPHRTPFGFLLDSGQYGKCLEVGLNAVGYQDFRRQQQEARANGRLLGIGISTMTEPLGAGNSREYDILGIKMFDSADLKIHMTGKAILRTGAKTQGQGHE